MTTLGTRTVCLYGSGYPHTAEDNAASGRKRCTYCGGPLTRFRGLWGVFVWQGTGRYPATDAQSMHASVKRAELARTGELVVRWIPDWGIS